MKKIISPKEALGKKNTKVKKKKKHSKKMQVNPD